jgi:hypothetical protein
LNSSPAEDGKSVKRFRPVGHYLGSSNSFARGVLVNLDHCSVSTEEQNSVVVAQTLNVGHNGPRIERCEFEQLLQRAMEILNARDLKAQLKTAASTSAV